MKEYRQEFMHSLNRRDSGEGEAGEEKAFSLKEAMWDLARITGAAILFFAAISCFFRPALTRGDSMAPTLRDGDRTLISAVGYQPRRGDVVVLRDPSQQDKHLVKRIIAMEGDQVDIDFGLGVVYINGLPLEEPYCAQPTYTGYDTEFPVVVPPEHLFVLGDNRNYSHDSRSSDVGMLPLDSVEGKVVWRFYPFDRIGVIR